MSKDWQAYARHILDAIGKIRRIRQRSDWPAQPASATALNRAAM